MTASAIRVDGPSEWEHRRLGDLVDDRAGVDVEELHAPELALADATLDLFFEEGPLPIVVLGQPPPHAPSISNMCSSGAVEVPHEGAGQTDVGGGRRLGDER